MGTGTVGEGGVEGFDGDLGIVEVGEEKRGDEVLEGEFNQHIFFFAHLPIMIIFN